MIKQGDIKIGDMVRCIEAGSATPAQLSQDPIEGIVTNIQQRETIFSEKYGITETETCVHVLHEGTIKYFYLEEDLLEVIND